MAALIQRLHQHMTTARLIDELWHAAVAFAVTAAERWAVWYSSRNPRTFKRIKSMVDRFWFAEQHHKNITLSRRYATPLADFPACQIGPLGNLFDSQACMPCCR